MMVNYLLAAKIPRGTKVIDYRLLFPYGFFIKARPGIGIPKIFNYKGETHYGSMLHVPDPTLNPNSMSEITRLAEEAERKFGSKLEFIPDTANVVNSREDFFEKLIEVMTNG